MIKSVPTYGVFLHFTIKLTLAAGLSEHTAHISTSYLIFLLTGKHVHGACRSNKNVYNVTLTKFVKEYNG